MQKGIDVSYVQGIIDWDKVSRVGIDFAILRAGYGTATEDGQFARNIKNCNRLGIPVGVYWFSYAKTAAQARQEAAKCLQTIAPYQVDLFVAWDWENDSYAKAVAAGVTPTQALVSGMAEAFLGAVEDAGYMAVNYSNVDYLTRFFSAAVTERWPVWVAQWPSRQLWQWPQTAAKSQYAGAHCMWQFGCFTGVSGIGGAVDADILYEEEFGMKEMTGEEIFNKLCEYLAELPCPEDQKANLKEAVSMGITDGTWPMLFTPRYQAALMAKKAATLNK